MGIIVQGIKTSRLPYKHIYTITLEAVNVLHETTKQNENGNIDQGYEEK